MKCAPDVDIEVDKRVSEEVEGRGAPNPHRRTSGAGQALSSRWENSIPDVDLVRRCTRLKGPMKDPQLGCHAGEEGEKGGRGILSVGESPQLGMYGPPPFCKRRMRMTEKVCANVSGLCWSSDLLA